MKLLKVEFLNLSRFGLIGIIGNVINYLTYILLLELIGLNITASSILGYFLGCIISFHFGRTWIFGVRNEFKITQFVKFIISHLIGCTIMSNIILFLNSNYTINSSLIWLLAAFPTIIINYYLLRKWVFNNRKLISNQRWGGISKLDFLQYLASSFISYINPAIIHNLEKYYAIKKSFYLSCIEEIEGDYLEFGVFEGSSFSHAIRCYLKSKIYMPTNKSNEIRFFGFDSFEGFGKLDKDEIHPFYVDEQFKTSFNHVKKKINKVAKGSSVEANLIKGFLNESLREGPSKYNIKKARIIFIDLDIYSASKDAFNFCKGLIQEGTIIILDDYFSYKGSLNKGVAKAFEELKTESNFCFRELMPYGLGGKVYICDKLATHNELDINKSLN
tara:strand:+ start:1089 stop:2252 length:1164 start_codon:yes stop_codon:yes gene_type:complete